jgi:quinol monooxygenase YgiN
MRKRERREFLTMSAATIAGIGIESWVFARGGDMYGLIGRMNASPGKREQLIEILLEGVANMPGCLSYVVAEDARDANAIWITEVWDSKESHDASLSLPSVRAAIAKGRPLIAGFGDSFVTTPVGGQFGNRVIG